MTWFLPRVLSILALQSLLQTTWYYFGGKLNRTTDVIITGIVLSVLLFVRARQKMLHDGEKISPRKLVEMTETIRKPFTEFLCLLISVFSFAFLLRHASAFATAESIRTPWPLLPSGTFLAFAALFLSQWIATRHEAPLWIQKTLASFSILSLTLIASLLYKLGFGFDGFVHQASERVLLETGNLVPHPPYYIGQYVFVTWLARVFSIPLPAVDTFLVPLFAGFLPWLFFPAHQSSSWRILSFTILIPLFPFVATTPQSFAYLIGFVGLGFAFHQTSTVLRASSIILGLWALAIHPLAGLPFLATSLAILLQCSEKKFASAVSWILLVLAGLSAPLAFLARSWITQSSLTLQSWSVDAGSRALEPFRTWINHLTERSLTLWPGWASFVDAIFPLALIVLAVSALFLEKEQRRTHASLIFLAALLLIANILLNTLSDFSFLISYERRNYSDRLFLLAGFFLILPAIVGLSRLLKRIHKQKRTVILLSVLFFTAWQGARIYNSLPRHDASVIGHGWSVGKADIDATRWIEEDSRGEPYTVLANQSVSAAALQLFGFKRYAGEVFYYPLPTGGPLYQLFLEATKPTSTRDVIEQAAELSRSQRVYVVLNRYWPNADRSAENLFSLSNATHHIQNDAVRIYRFDLPQHKGGQTPQPQRIKLHENQRIKDLTPL